MQLMSQPGTISQGAQQQSIAQKINMQSVNQILNRAQGVKRSFGEDITNRIS